jgi:glycosyltransferase involved in cell wall biosynthesis
MFSWFQKKKRAVSVVTVTFDTYFFTRLLVERVRFHMGRRPYEIIVVDRGSTDGTCEWMAKQPDVRLISMPQTTAAHGHGEAAQKAARQAKHDIIALLDSDAHPVSPDWLDKTADRLDEHHRLAGAVFHGGHTGNPYGWYIHPSFLCFFRKDAGKLVILGKKRGETTDTGEEATIRVLDAGLGIVSYPLEKSDIDAGHKDFPTVGAGVFHAWYGTRLVKDTDAVGNETAGNVTGEAYLNPVVSALRARYGLTY